MAEAGVTPRRHGPRPVVAVVGPGVRSAGGVSSVIATFMGSALGERYALVRVTTHRDGPPLAKLVQGFTAYGHLAGLLLGRRVDLVWIHVASNWSFRRKALVAELARLGRRPYVLHIHGGLFDAYYRSASRVERSLIRRAMRRATQVFALTPSWEAKLRLIEPAASVTCVMNPVRLPAIEDRVDARTVVSLGRLSVLKGSRVLLSAFDVVARSDSEVTLVLAGDGEVDELRRAAEDAGLASRVLIPGWLEHADAMRLLDEAAVFVLPSQDEGLPIALLEAMARGLPCVATPVGGIPDVITDNVNGVFVAVDDPTGLAQAVQRILEDRDLARCLGKRARESAERLFSVEAAARELISVFDGAVAR